MATLYYKPARAGPEKQAGSGGGFDNSQCFLVATKLLSVGM
jgi:hypothetical protein